jgi:Helix-turn-helix domain
VIIDEYELYRPVDVAAATGISLSSVYRLVNSGELKHFLMEEEGLAIRIPGLAVEELLTKRIDAAVAERAAA